MHSSSPLQASTQRPGAKGWQRHARAHLALARVSNTPTVVSNVLAGTALATTLAFDGVIVLLTLAMVLFYTAGMYLNDIFDRDIDRQHRPDRPLPSGAVSVPVAAGVTVALFALGLGLLAFTSREAFISGVVVVLVIIVYDAWHKANPIGPFVMATTRSLVYITAFLVYSANVSADLVVWSSLMLLYVAGLTSIAKTETGPAGVKYWPFVAILVPAAYAMASISTIGGTVAILAFLGWVVYAASFAYVSARRSIGGAITRLIAGISLLDAMVLATQGAWWGMVIAMLAFAATLFFQRYIRGT
ncbi:MAG: UbiA family prenyltransferase [Chloroflexota bacterium]|nr:UbiA family prenyltransferase [Chloroflexota bacterium]